MNIINFTMTLDIILYSKSACPNCVTAKQLLKNKELVFEERDVEDEGWAIQFAEECPGIRQMPQIIINGQRVGGLAGLQAALKQVGL